MSTCGSVVGFVVHSHNVDAMQIFVITPESKTVRRTHHVLSSQSLLQPIGEFLTAEGVLKHWIFADVLQAARVVDDCAAVGRADFRRSQGENFAVEYDGAVGIFQRDGTCRVVDFLAVVQDYVGSFGESISVRLNPERAARVVDCYCGHLIALRVEFEIAA